MQSYAQGIRNAVWGKLDEIFKKYAGTKPYIEHSELERVVREVLGETSPAEIDYVMKNLFRLDADNNGYIDFPQLGNFLLKRHCGEIALQRMHMNNQMSMGAQRKMNLIEFTVLMNRAYAFLGVKVDDQGCKAIFDDADSDKDGIISYEEYFSFVHKHILKPKPSDVVVKPVPTLDEFISLLRQYLWAQARRIYDIYDKDKNQKLDVKEFGEVIKAIMTDYSDADVIEMLTRSFKLNLSPDGFLKFEVFAPFFIVCLGKLGLSKFARHHPKKRTLTREEFTLLFKRSYNILGAQRVTDNLLSLFFSAIDTNRDGKITYAEYLDWIVNFLSVSKYFGTLRLLEDTPPDRLRMILPDSELESNAYYVTKFKFSNLDLARRARLRTLELILEFDANKNSNLEEDEIINILKKLMKSDDFDVFYVIANVFRYDVNNDGFITYDEMADFFLEMHFGELALQRLHRIRKFLRGDERLMNFDEFSLTLENGLSYIGVVATKEELATLFSEIDMDKSGWITYKIYLEFLIAYFGTKSKVRYELDFKSKVDKTLANTKLSPIERLGDIVIKALKELLKDYNPFNSLDAEKIRKFLMEIFKLTPSEAEYVLLNLLRSELFTGVLNEMALAILFMEILFAEIMLTRWHRQKKFKRWMERLISQDEFVQLVGETCFWIQPAIPTGLLIEIFKLLDTDNDGFITYDQYINFVLQMFKLKHKRQWPFEIASEKVDTPALTKELSEDIWSDLRALYMHYVKGKYLQENELELLVKEVLHETTKKELEYIFWNMFRYDPNGDKNIEFEEFAPFILAHAAEIALQRFHYDQVRGKNNLTKDEFKVVFREAYHFLKTLNKTDEVLGKIFDNLDTNRDGLVSYKDYMTWVAIHIARVIR